MRRPAPGKGRRKERNEAALVRRLTGALPRPSVQGRARLRAWFAGIARNAAGRALAAAVARHPPLANVLGAIAETSPYLWDLVQADPARKDEAGKDLIRAIFGKDAIAEDRIL